MEWKDDDDRCGCVQVKIEERVLFECNQYGEERRRWRGAPDNTSYKWWNCHGGRKLLRKLCMFKLPITPT